MPLHGIPLCDFKYAGEIYSGATFKYDTAEKILKSKSKLLYKNSKEVKKKCHEKLLSKGSKEIEKSFEKLLCKFTSSVLKNDKKFLCDEFLEMEKSILTKNLKIRAREENKLYKTYLLRTKGICFVKNSTVRLRREYPLINVESGINLIILRNNDLSLKSSRSLEKTDIIKLKIEIGKALNDAEINGLSIEKSKELSNEKCRSLVIELSKQVLRIWNNGFNKNKAFSLTAVDRENVLLNKFDNVFLSRNIQSFISKHDTVCLAKIKVKNICKFAEKYIVRDNLRQICFDLGKRLYRRCNLKDMFKGNYRLISKIVFKNTDKMNFQFTLRKNSSKRITKNYGQNYLNKLDLRRISRSIKSKFLYKWSTKSISKMNIYGLDKVVLKYIFKDNYRLLRRIIIKNICYGNEGIGLIKKKINNISEYDNKYLETKRSLDIYKQLEKELLDLTTIDIAQIQSYYLENDFNREIYKKHCSDNKFIDIIKRWWWLKPTSPRDSIIIPNKDFDYDSSLLNNQDYKYLRFSNHPIGWGSSWGIDFNIPAYAVSVEIMLDLVNILIMIWHHDVQAWMCCSGKESMQFVMELLYDWYTLDTSKPNTDYYRAYRWIRWEAEKVYFLNLDTGLQAIGVLVENLIDYLKQHYFNLVPIWRNPKHMDIERNFNKEASNGDLMKNLDKLKGKRYYCIETQNIEKKNILGR